VKRWFAMVCVFCMRYHGDRGNAGKVEF